MPAETPDIPAEPWRSAAHVDARGHRCPVPTLRLRRALEALSPGDRIWLLADDPMARIDVPHFVNQMGHNLHEQVTRGADLMFHVEKQGFSAPDPK
ncbi:MAG: sulfurtransferase TusA family protein [Asticcacaulis sp.]